MPRAKNPNLHATGFKKICTNKKDSLFHPLSRRWDRESEKIIDLFSLPRFAVITQDLSS